MGLRNVASTNWKEFIYIYKLGSATNTQIKEWRVSEISSNYTDGYQIVCIKTY